MLAKTKEAVVESDLDHCLCFVEIKRSRITPTPQVCVRKHIPQLLPIIYYK